MMYSYAIMKINIKHNATHYVINVGLKDLYNTERLFIILVRDITLIRNAGRSFKL